MTGEKLNPDTVFEVGGLAVKCVEFLARTDTPLPALKEASWVMLMLTSTGNSDHVKIVAGPDALHALAELVGHSEREVQEHVRMQGIFLRGWRWHKKQLKSWEKKLNQNRHC